LGGDEFVVVFKINKLLGLEDFIAKAQDEIIHPFVLEEFDIVVNVGVSYGIVKSSEYPTKSADELLKLADEKMYSHKER
jgi:GGDEF domain-containing protein